MFQKKKTVYIGGTGVLKLITIRKTIRKLCVIKLKATKRNSAHYSSIACKDQVDDRKILKELRRSLTSQLEEKSNLVSSHSKQ